MSEIITFRLDTEEVTILLTEAEARGMSLNEYARHLLRYGHKTQTLAADQPNVYVSGDEYLAPQPPPPPPTYPDRHRGIIQTSRTDASQLVLAGCGKHVA